MMEAAKSKYWLDQATAEIIQRHPEGEIIVSSGHSPSGNYHFGLLREFLIASAVTGKLRQLGRTAKHIDFVDDLDVFRKVPVNVSPEWQKYLGQPLYLVPDPFGDCHSSYGDHFLLEVLYEPLKRLGVEFESIRSHQQYQKGVFTQSIEQSLTKLDEAKAIITEVSHRQLEADWSPVQILSDDNNLRDWRYSGWDKSKQVVKYKSAKDGDGEVSYTAGRVKLDWRLDWPARWALLGVGVEPFGRDHATKGGSYDTGSQLVKTVFGGQAPFPLPYEFVNLQGQTKKMSKSAGNVITPGDILEIIPPEIVRYYLIKARPAKMLVFDSGIGLSNLIDEYAGVEADVLAGRANDFKEAFEFAAAGKVKQTISSVPFSHLVTLYQAALADEATVFKLLEKSIYAEVASKQKDIISGELKYLSRWLKDYAPDSVKFNLQEKLPQADLSDDQKDFLGKLADAIEKSPPKDAQAAHDLIYQTTQDGPVKPLEAFQALYKVLIGQDSGPRAGAFLATLGELKGNDWLVNRLRLQG